MKKVYRTYYGIRRKGEIIRTRKNNKKIEKMKWGNR